MLVVHSVWAVRGCWGAQGERQPLPCTTPATPCHPEGAGRARGTCAYTLRALTKGYEVPICPYQLARKGGLR
eukprot:6473695-Alexandrium_andersonii.AAC.1